MLDSLRPNRGQDDDDDETEDHVHNHLHDERTQFVLGTEEDETKEKAEVEHRESPSTSSAFDNAQATEEGRNGNKGWKEASRD